MPGTRLHPTEVTDLRTALLGVLPYAQSRLEDMAESAEECRPDGKPSNCGCYRRAYAFYARALEQAGHPDAPQYAQGLDHLEKLWATNPGPLCNGCPPA